MLDQMMLLASRQGTQNYALLEPLSQNFGNLMTYGYKSRRFEMFLRPEGTAEITPRTDVSQGPMELTNRPLDIGVEGPGYIAVTRQNGDLAYTRTGALMVNAKGQLVTPFGDLIGSGITLPASYSQVKIQRNGDVMLTLERGQEPKKIGTIPLVTFNNPEGLKVLGYNLVAASPESGDPALITDHNQIRQGMLERSNTNVQYTVTDLLRLNAGVLSNLKIAAFVDQIYRDATNLRQ